MRAITAEDLLAVDDGTRTEAGLRHNVRVAVQYLEAWLSGVGCVPLYNVMEDAATAEIARAQVWQWLKHGTSLESGERVDEALVRRIIADEMTKVRAALPAERVAKSLRPGRKALHRSFRRQDLRRFPHPPRVRSPGGERTHASSTDLTNQPAQRRISHDRFEERRPSPPRSFRRHHPSLQWAWPASGPEPDANKYGFLTLRPSFGEDEACLLVWLTYDITPDRLTEACFADGQLKLPTIKVTADRFGGDVIQHPKDLELFGAKLDEALRLLQDEWKVRRIHLFVGAPASSCFRVGQKMQARHQATFVCHETGTGRGSPFMQTIEILSDKVIVPSGQWIAF